MYIYICICICICIYIYIYVYIYIYIGTGPQGSATVIFGQCGVAMSGAATSSDTWIVLDLRVNFRTSNNYIEVFEI